MTTMDFVLTDNRTDTHSFHKTDHVAQVTWRHPWNRTDERDVWVDYLGDHYVQEPGLTNFVKLGSHEMLSYELDGAPDLTWHRVSDEELIRRSPYGDRDHFELLFVNTPDSYTQLTEDDRYRAYLWDIDLDDFDDEHLLPVLDCCGYVDVRSNLIDYRIAETMGCERSMDADSCRRIADFVGHGQVASDIVAVYGTSWQIPQTFHEQDAGYNSAWRDSYDPELKPWGSITQDELTFWMCSLGCAEHVILPDLASLVASEFDGIAYVFSHADEPLDERVAFGSIEAAEAYAEATGVAPDFLSVDITEGRRLSARPDDPFEVTAYAPVSSVPAMSAGIRR